MSRARGLVSAMDTKTFLGQRSPCSSVSGPPASCMMRTRRGTSSRSRCSRQSRRSREPANSRGTSSGGVARASSAAMASPRFAVKKCAPWSRARQRVSGGTGMELGDEIDRRRQALRHALASETLVAEVFVDVPDPTPFPLCCGCHKPRAAVAETEGGQPALCEEAVRLCDRRRVPFQHERPVACAADAQAVHGLLESLQLHRPLRACADAVADHPLQELAQVRPTRLLPLLQPDPPPSQIDGTARPNRHPHLSQSRARSKTRVTTRQPSKYSSTRARASRQCPA